MPLLGPVTCNLDCLPVTWTNFLRQVPNHEKALREQEVREKVKKGFCIKRKKSKQM